MFLLFKIVKLELHQFIIPKSIFIIIIITIPLELEWKKIKIFSIVCTFSTIFIPWSPFYFWLFQLSHEWFWWCDIIGLGRVHLLNGRCFSMPLHSCLCSKHLKIKYSNSIFLLSYIHVNVISWCFFENILLCNYTYLCIASKAS